MYNVIVFVVAVLSGVTAAIAGFGIGSLLTPLIAALYGIETAVAAVAVPHALATAVRFVRLRSQVDWRVVRSFGMLSAIGGLAGAATYIRIGSKALTIVLATLLIATSVAGLTGWNTKKTPTGALAGAFGLLSGFFGGVAGNQGGLRAAALMSFGISGAAFVATSTAVGLMVDAVRTPIYLWRSGQQLYSLWVPIGIASAGVLIGTLAGERVLLGLSPERFRRLVSALIGGLGMWLLVQLR
ncbi:MAG TPA: sulfite exporter TauE/SafE family protein [Gemmatimonadaceae bacterium]|nr:sulfite exporter TauE/SafE family protein [Gemmatimonadaceae bacterium]